MGKKKDLTGLRFGSWLVLELAPYKRRPKWLCRCDCGTERVVMGGNLRGGLSESCGCSFTTHRLTHHPLYQTWSNMIARCLDPENTHWEDYGGRGVDVCERWRQSVADFIADVGDKPSPQHSLDRINNEGHYEPSNVRWATAGEQARNKRNTRMIDTPLGPMVLTDAAKTSGIPIGTLHYRLKRGWPTEHLFNQSYRKPS